MQASTVTQLTVKAPVNAPIEKVWTYWTSPHHVARWNQASDDWWTPWAKSDLRPGGEFVVRMEAKDGSSGFDYAGTYDEVQQYELISSVLGDGRKVTARFERQGNAVAITETFEAENTNSPELQRSGWQAILDSFKSYAEKQVRFELLHFDVLINAPVERVHREMLDDESFREWTSEFNASSDFRGSWEKGSKILFIGTDEQGKESGMVSRIRENIPNKLVNIEHLGILKEGKELKQGPEVEAWSGATEEYRFRDDNGGTLLEVYTDSTSEFKSYFEETWPKALKRLKSICER
jgi:uncharacterized protein YndB with AHSA1/START domain